MAFSIETLNLIANGARPISTSAAGSARRAIFHYITNDTHAVVGDADYFNDAAGMLNEGDIIIAAVDLDGTAQQQLYVVTDNDGTTVVVASNSSLSNIAETGIDLVLGTSSSKIGLFGATAVVQPVGAGQAAVSPALTDSSGGTPADTIAAIGGTYSQAEVRNAVASLAAKVNALITLTTALRLALVNLGAIKGAA